MTPSKEKIFVQTHNLTIKTKQFSIKKRKSSETTVMSFECRFYFKRFCHFIEARIFDVHFCSRIYCTCLTCPKACWGKKLPLYQALEFVLSNGAESSHPTNTGGVMGIFIDKASGSKVTVLIYSSIFIHSRKRNGIFPFSKQLYVLLRMGSPVEKNDYGNRKKMILFRFALTIQLKQKLKQVIRPI